jgi:hypothetical protein
MNKVFGVILAAAAMADAGQPFNTEASMAKRSLRQFRKRS